MKYKVLIQHFGDKQYWAGESREVANEHDAKILIDMGLIEPIEGESREVANEHDAKILIDMGLIEPIEGEKAKAAPKNKAEPKVQNKAEE